jgi:hypothetical protein
MSGACWANSGALQRWAFTHNARMRNINRWSVSFVTSVIDTSYCSEAEDVAVVLLVPVRAAMRGSFPLAGTYFQARLLPLGLCTVLMHVTCALCNIIDACHICIVHVKTSSYANAVQINEMFLAHDTVARPVQVLGPVAATKHHISLASGPQMVQC